MAVYAIYIEDDGNGGLEVHAKLERGIYRRGCKGERAAEVAKSAIKAWIEAGGEDWGNVPSTAIAEAFKNLRSGVH